MPEVGRKFASPIPFSLLEEADRVMGTEHMDD